MIEEISMLRKLRAEALALIATTRDCILSTSGPAGVQASIVACIVREDCIYVLVPSTIDLLFNLEHEFEVVLTSALWQMHGAALVLGEGDGRHGTAPWKLSRRANAAGARLVEVFPVRMHLEPTDQRRYRETIDFSRAHTSYLLAR
jgi:hypothetical protein